MRGSFNPQWYAIVLVCLLANACGGGSSIPDPADNPLPTGQWTGTAANSATVGLTIEGVPEVPLDGLAHSPSTGETILELTGSEYLQQYHGLVDGTALVINSPAEPPAGEYPLAYGLYKFANLNDVEPQWLNIECLPRVLGEEYIVGLADYTEREWRWFGPVTFPEFQLDLRDLRHQFVSELGNMYFIVLTRHGNGATLSLSSLTVAPAGEDSGRLPGAPYQLAATDGVYEAKIVIEWAAGLGATGYDLWRRASVDGDWVDLAETEGTRYEDTAVEPGQLYWYKVFAVNEFGRSAGSNIDEGHAGELSGGGDLPAPHEIWASDGAHPDHVVVEWGYTGEAGHFQLSRRTEGTDWQDLVNVEARRYEDFAVEPGVIYKYRVRAVLGERVSDWSGYDTGYAAGGGGELSAPVNLHATDGVYPDHVVLEWGHEGDYGHFNIWRRVAEGGEWVNYANHDGESFRYEDWDVTPGVVYQYKVRAIFEERESGWSNYDYGHASADPAPPPAPFHLVASKGTYLDKIRVEWGYDGDKDYCELWRKQDGEGFEWTKIAEVADNAYNDLELPGDFTFIYKARAVRGEQFSEWSNTDFGYLGDAPGELPVPFELHASKGEFADRIQLGWNCESGYGYFEVWRKQDGEAFEWHKIADVEAKQYADTELPGDFTFLYKVRARLGELEGGWSNIDHGYLADPVETCSLEVILHNAEGHALPGYAVLYGLETPVVHEADVNGVVRFAELPRGLYVVVPMHREIAFDPARRVVDFREGELSREIGFTGAVDAGQVHRLRGVVYKFNGALGPNCFTPLVGVTINIALVGSEETWQVTTDEAGYWTMPELPAGIYHVTAVKDGYTFTPELHDPVINGEGLPGRGDFRGYPIG